MPLSNCEIELDLSWPDKCIIPEISRTFRAVGNPPVQQGTAATTGPTFQINNAKLCVPVVTLSINDNTNFFRKFKARKLASWNKNRSEITTQPKSDNLDHLINLILRNINRLFVGSFIQKW